MRRWVLVLVAGFGALTAGRAIAADAQVTVPQSKVGDMLVLSPSERAAFIRGFLTASAAANIPVAACWIRWYYEMGGAEQMEKSFLDLKTAAPNPDAQTGPPPELLKGMPMAMHMQMAAFGYCANQK